MSELRIDGQKLQYHPARVAQWQASKDAWETAKSVYPLYLEVSPVGSCNHRCRHCAVDYIGYKNAQLDAVVTRERLFEMGDAGVKSVMFAGEGEPLLHKQINNMVFSAWEAGIDTAFTTNGVLLNKLDLASVTWVKVSVNAGSRSTYAKVHQTKEKDWDAVWANLRDAVKRKGSCTIGVQMVLLPENWSGAHDLARLCRNTGVDYLVIKPYSQHQFSINKMASDAEHLRPEYWSDFEQSYTTPEFKAIARVASMKAVQEPIPYDKCNSTPYFWAYVMASGDVYSCSAYLLDQRFLLGNLNTQGFKEIWEGEKRHENWKLMQSLNIHECRQACRMHQSNLYLNEFEFTQHINFV